MKERQESLLAFVGVVIGLELSPPPAVPPQLLGKRLLRQQASPAGTLVSFAHSRNAVCTNRSTFPFVLGV